MRNPSAGFLFALAVAWASPAPAQENNRVAELEAKVGAQEARIRALEEQLERVLRADAAAGTASADAPLASPAASAAAQQQDFPTVKLIGRLQIDSLLRHEGEGKATGTQVRRAQLGAAGMLAPHLRYQAVAEFAGSRVALEDTILGYQVTPSTEIVGGYFKPPITSDEMTSDLYTLFLERSAFAGAFAPGRRVGLGINHAGRGWGFRGGLFSERDDALLDTNRREAWLVSGRVHADLLPGKAVLHAATSAYYTRTGSDELASLSQRPEANRAPVEVSTGSFEAEHASFFGGELGYGFGPVTVQAEGGLIRYGGGPAHPLFWGISGQVAWRITGEERPYDPKAGVFGRVVPRGRLGALETGLRFTHLDLADETIFGGRLTTYGAVLNWYPITRLRLAGNIIHSETAGRAPQKTEQTLFTIRGGIDW